MPPLSHQLHFAQGTWLQGLRCLEFVSLLTTAGYLGFDLSGLPASVHDVRLTATELQGSINADHQLQTLRLSSGRALEIEVEPPTGGADVNETIAPSQVLSAASAFCSRALSAGVGPQRNPVLFIRLLLTCMVLLLGRRAWRLSPQRRSSPSLLTCQRCLGQPVATIQTWRLCKRWRPCCDACEPVASPSQRRPYPTRHAAMAIRRQRQIYA